jgi:hypothetical protein
MKGRARVNEGDNRRKRGKGEERQALDTCVDGLGPTEDDLERGGKGVPERRVLDHGSCIEKIQP